MIKKNSINRSKRQNDQNNKAHRLMLPYKRDTGSNIQSWKSLSQVKNVCSCFSVKDKQNLKISMTSYTRLHTKIVSW